MRALPCLGCPHRGHLLFCVATATRSCLGMRIAQQYCRDLTVLSRLRSQRPGLPLQRGSQVKYVCMHACMHVCEYAYIHTQTHVCVCVCVWVGGWVGGWMGGWVGGWGGGSVCMQVHTHVHMYLCMYACMYACTYGWMDACLHLLHLTKLCV